MRTRPGLLSEIEDIRGRILSPDWDDGITRLFLIYDQTRTLEGDDERNAYFLVASTAAIETYFKWEIRSLIDSGDDRYINNALSDDWAFTWNHELLLAVHGKKVTIGELVAHSVRLSSVDAVAKVMGKVLKTDFIALVNGARAFDLIREQGLDAPTVIRDASETLHRVKRTFELRHIICHEAHPSIMVCTEEVKELCYACYTFVMASHYGIAFHKNPNAPLTLAEAHALADKRIDVLGNEIKAIEQVIIANVPAPMQDAFSEMQKSWRLQVEREADFNSFAQVNGNRGALDARLTTEKRYSDRLHELNDYVRRVERFLS